MQYILSIYADTCNLIHADDAKQSADAAALMFTTSTSSPRLTAILYDR